MSPRQLWQQTRPGNQDSFRGDLFVVLGMGSHILPAVECLAAIKGTAPQTAPSGRRYCPSEAVVRARVHIAPLSGSRDDLLHF